MTEAKARRRRSELGKIHIGKKQLFDDHGDYRDMPQRFAGVRPSADLDEAGRWTVIEHLQACGVESRPVRKRSCSGCARTLTGYYSNGPQASNREA